MQGDLYMLQLALLTDTNINCCDYDDRTPLHVAGDLGKKAIWELLIKKGADQNRKDRWGKLPSLQKPTSIN